MKQKILKLLYVPGHLKPYSRINGDAKANAIENEKLQIAHWLRMNG